MADARTYEVGVTPLLVSLRSYYIQYTITDVGKKNKLQNYVNVLF